MVSFFKQISKNIFFLENKNSPYSLTLDLSNADVSTFHEKFLFKKVKLFKGEEYKYDWKEDDMK